MSIKGYGLFFYILFVIEWNMGWDSSDYYLFKVFGGDLDYYFIYGFDFYIMVDRYMELIGKFFMFFCFVMGLYVGIYFGGIWKNEEMIFDKYLFVLCKCLCEEEVFFDLFWLDFIWRLFNIIYGNGGCCFEWCNMFKDLKVMFDSCYV